MPPPEFTVRNVAKIVGEDTPIDVIGELPIITACINPHFICVDVASQTNSPGWTLGKWAEYCELEPSQRDKIRNVISLEISGTKLADQVLPPRLVRELDWVEMGWPNKSRGKGQYPKVQLYCLMGVATAYTVSLTESLYPLISHSNRTGTSILRALPCTIMCCEAQRWAWRYRFMSPVS
jgi:F-box/leucine-rich repeat protein 10/11